MAPAPSERATIVDADGEFQGLFGARGPTAFWVRPDRYLGWRGDVGTVHGLKGYLQGLFRGDSAPR